MSDMFTLPTDNERFFIPHCYFFSFKTLSELLAQAGFSVVEARVSLTFRNRAYLQIVAAKEDVSPATHPPYDDPTRVMQSVAANIERHAKGETLDG